MKVLLAIIITFGSINPTIAQVEFKLYGYDSCNKQVKAMNSYELKKGEVIYSVLGSSKTIYLSEAGKYTLLYVLDNIDTLAIGKRYNILPSMVSFSDTINISPIHEYYETISNPGFVGYCC